MQSNPDKFYKKSLSERHEFIRKFASFSEVEMNVYQAFGSLGEEVTESFTENTIGVMEVPLGIATNFIVNGKEVMIPMATEESSVVAAASHAAKYARETGGFFATTTNPIMFSQIQVIDCEDLFGARIKILERKEEILDVARDQDPVLIENGGGPLDLEVRVLDDVDSPMLVIHLLVNTLDAMGANAVNTMAESIAPLLEKITGGHVNLRIISNLADKRLARVRCEIKKEMIGEKAVKGIVNAYRFAVLDPYRAATHNKGIMNGISAVVLATGNDTRAVEAGAHAFATRNGQYSPLSTWEQNKNGDIIGTLELPLAVGILGGATSLHPKAKTNLRLMKVESSKDLAEIIVSVGLAQNFAALNALATEGIQAGHMKLHSKNIAMMAGATGSTIDKVAQQLVEEGNVRLDRAKELIKSIK